MFRGIEITSRKNSGEIISQRSSLQGCIFVGSVYLFQTRRCCVLRPTEAEMMFRGNEKTSRTNVW